jgi:hypothetical protein
MPAMDATYSYEPFYEAYEELGKPGEEIGEYNDWQQPVRSVIFLFQNRCQHLRNDRVAAAFLKRPGRKFIIAHRDKLPALRRVARDADKTLYVVFDRHPYARMVSDVPNAEDARRVASHILDEPPADMQAIGSGGASFEDTITLLGSTVEPPEVRPGQSAKVSFYYRCEKLIDHDWQIFVHGDASRGGSQRIHADHFPLDGLYPTTEWQAGEIIRDTFEVTVPANYAYDGFVLWTGWYRGEARLRLVNNAPNDGDNRVRGPEVKVIRDGAP